MFRNDDFISDRIMRSRNVSYSLYLVNHWFACDFKFDHQLMLSSLRQQQADIKYVSIGDGSYQGVLCFNYLVNLLKRLISCHDDKVWLRDSNIYLHLELSVRSMIHEIWCNMYSLPAGRCREFTNSVEWVISRERKFIPLCLDDYLHADRVIDFSLQELRRLYINRDVEEVHDDYQS